MCASMAVVGILAEVGFVRAFLPVSIALTTTALGTLVPIVRDTGIIRSPMGRAVMAKGAIGELFPIIAISVLLSTQGTWAALGLLAAFGVAALVLARIVTGVRGRWLATAIRSGADTSSQTTVRFSVLLLVALLAVASKLGLDVVLGAFAAGIVLRIALPEGDHALESKLDGLGYGFFIPAFFVVSGMNLDVGSVVRDPARMLVFFVLMLVIRGLPVAALFWRWMPGIDAIRLGLYAATALPLIVAITQIALQAGVMRADNAAALVGAGLLTVIFLPMLARALPERAVGRPSSGGPLDENDAVAAIE
jgi:Kef-type K+ transport system membrane component KefB